MEGGNFFQGLAEGGGELYGVLGGGEEGASLGLLGEEAELADVLEGVGVVIGEAEAGGGGEAGGGEALVERLRAGEGAEGEWAFWVPFGKGEGAADEVDGGFCVVCDVRAESFGFFFAEEDGVSATQGAERFAEVTGGDEVIVEVFGGEEEEVEVAVEAAVLEAVVENVDGGGVFGFGEAACGFAIGGDVDGEAGVGCRRLGEEEGFVAEAGGGAGGVDAFDAVGGAAVAPGKDGGGETVLVEEGGEGLDDGGFAGASGGEAADAEDGAGEAFRGGSEGILDGLAGGVEGDEWEQEGASQLCLEAASISLRRMVLIRDS